MAILFAEDIFHTWSENVMHPLGEKLSSNPSLCIYPPHYRQFAFHFIIPLIYLFISLEDYLSDKSKAASLRNLSFIGL